MHPSTATLAMTFTEATDRLTACPTLETLADVLGASYGTVRQARLAPDSGGYRNPPPGWQAGVAKLARQRARELVKLAKALEGDV